MSASPKASAIKWKMFQLFPPSCLLGSLNLTQLRHANVKLNVCKWRKHEQGRHKTSDARHPFSILSIDWPPATFCLLLLVTQLKRPKQTTLLLMANGNWWIKSKRLANGVDDFASGCFRKRLLLLLRTCNLATLSFLFQSNDRQTIGIKQEIIGACLLTHIHTSNWLSKVIVVLLVRTCHNQTSFNMVTVWWLQLSSYRVVAVTMPTNAWTKQNPTWRREVFAIRCFEVASNIWVGRRRDQFEQSPSCVLAKNWNVSELEAAWLIDWFGLWKKSQDQPSCVGSDQFKSSRVESDDLDQAALAHERARQCDWLRAKYLLCNWRLATEIVVS